MPTTVTQTVTALYWPATTLLVRQLLCKHISQMMSLVPTQVTVLVLTTISVAVYRCAVALHTLQTAMIALTWVFDSTSKLNDTV
jgi:hypothetical protein